MRILLYEPDSNGHHFPYLGRVIKSLSELPVECVLATTAQAVESKEFATNLAPFGDALRVEPVCKPAPEGAVKIGRQRATEFRHLLKSLNADHAIVMYADGLWQWAQFDAVIKRKRFRVPVEAGVFRGAFTYDDASGKGAVARRILMRSLLRTATYQRLWIHDELYHRFATENSPTPPRVELTLMPDPVEIRPPQPASKAREMLGLDTSTRWLVCAGMIDSRKGADLAIDTFAAMHNEPWASDVGLLLAGPHRDEITARLDQPDARALLESGRIVSLDRFLNADEMFAAAAAAEIVLAPYPNHSGRSSIIIWAAAAGRRCIGAARGAIGEMIRSEQLGQVINPTDTKAFIDTIRSTLENPWSDTDAARVSQFATQHSVEVYQQRASAFIRQRLEQGV